MYLHLVIFLLLCVVMLTVIVCRNVDQWRFCWAAFLESNIQYGACHMMAPYLGRRSCVLRTVNEGSILRQAAGSRSLCVDFKNGMRFGPFRKHLQTTTYNLQRK